MGVTRRDFLGGLAAGAATFTFVPGSVLGMNGQTPANERLNIAGVGVGGMGKSNLKAVSSENIVALCDVDDEFAGPVYKEFPNAKRFRDYRKMLDQMDKQIDAVIIATPDHTHAVIALDCIKRGKHVYVQKPLTRTVYEARILTEAARKYKVVTQMGNQGASSEEVRLVCEWIWDGAIGKVYEVHAWTNRPVWPQGIDRPKETPPVPGTMDWDLWIGPSPFRPYHPIYHPFNWRAWQDFGTGALGDMACHVLDPVFRALKLQYPVSVEGCVAVQYKEMWRPWTNTETYPIASIVRYQFPARGDMPPVRLYWYDGGMLPPRPDELEKDRRLGDSEGGVLFVGDKGKLMTGCYSRGPQLLPYSRMKEYTRPEKTLPRVNTSHEMHWVECCKKGLVEGPSSHFGYAGPFTESVVMGNLAMRFPNRLLLWDGPAMKVTNEEAANAFVNPPYRQGWSLEL